MQQDHRRRIGAAELGIADAELARVDLLHRVEARVRGGACGRRENLRGGEGKGGQAEEAAAIDWV
jgi:hypothetical protein